MNERMLELAKQVWPDPNISHVNHLKFADLVVQDYAKKTIHGLMSDPVFVQAMDEYYEKKWAHRFD